jgi:hypothetical protein
VICRPHARAAVRPQFQKSLQDPKADPAKAQQEFENKVLQLRKTQFIDPYGLQDGGE